MRGCLSPASLLRHLCKFARQGVIVFCARFHHHYGMRLVLLVCVALGSGCALVCDVPDDAKPTYSCEPLPAGSLGCVGGPLEDSPDRTFQPNCRAEIPSCESEYGSRSFLCSELEPSVFVWSESL